MTDLFDLRPAAPADVPALLDLVTGAYRGDSARRGWTHEADLLDGRRTDEAALLDAISDPRGAVLLARRGGEAAACVHVRAVSERRAYLGMLSVRPDLQAAGLGRSLIEGAEAYARDALQTEVMEMTVIRQRTELIAWYERRGYRLTGETRPFPATDPRFGLPRRDDLAFVVLEKSLAPSVRLDG